MIHCQPSWDPGMQPLNFSFPTEEMFLSTVEALQTIADGSP